MTLSHLKIMLRARRFDEAMLDAVDQLQGHYHVSTGLETSAAALAAIKTPADVVLTNYRNHAHLLAVGAAPADLYAEIFARAGSPQLGRSGTFHLAAPEHGVPYTSAMVAGAVPMALGVAFAQARRGEAGITIVFFGDGAFGEGVVHESLNLAALWRLPVLFMCENNGAPAGGQANGYQMAEQLTDLANVNKVYSAHVEARDATLTVEAAKAMSQRVRADAKPAFLELRAGSWPGNKPFFPQNLTGHTDLLRASESRGEIWYDHDDPVLAEVRRLLSQGASASEIDQIDQVATTEMKEALAEVLARPGADPDDAASDVWASR